MSKKLARFFSIFFLPLIVFAANHEVERRAAFDIGSGKIKVQVSDVDLTAGKIANVLFTDTARVPLREDLVRSLDGRLSREIRNQAVAAIKDLMKKIEPFHPEACHAIGTESLRLAKDGEGFREQIEKETGLSVTIVSQEEEGILGFVSAVSEAGIDPERAIAWDFGGGSFQVTAKCEGRYCVYEGRLGKVPLKETIIKIQGKEDRNLSPNPITRPQADEAIQCIKNNISNVPEELRRKIGHPDAVVLGVGIHPLWGMKKSAEFNKADVLEELEARLNLDDEAIRIKDSIPLERKDAAFYVASNLILAYGVMEALEMAQVRYVGTLGANAVGALLSPQYWRK
jgi:exopolyphosphatase / guanosine-5'-triphosphate,3'-diphosphate pyrophosphatase